jgi:hypothetical protein
MKNKIIVSGLAVLLGGACVVRSAYAANNIYQTGGTNAAPEIAWSGADDETDVQLDSNATQVTFNGTANDLHAVLDTLGANAWYLTNVSNITFNANLSVAVSAEQLNAIYSALSGASHLSAKISGLVVASSDIVYDDITTTLPTNWSFNYDNSVVHIPDTTTPEAAVNLFKSISNTSVVVAAGNNFTVNDESGTTSVHLPAGTAIADLVSLARTLGSDIMVAENGADKTYVTTDSQNKMTINLPSATTEEEAKQIIASLSNVTAKVKGSTFELEVENGKIENKNHEHHDAAPSVPSPWTCPDNKPAGVADLFQIDRKGSSATLYFTPVNDDTNRYHIVFGNEEGQELYSQLSAEVTHDSNNGVQSVTINDLDPKAKYSFQVMAVNGCAVGERSNWLTSHKTGISYRYNAN